MPHAEGLRGFAILLVLLFHLFPAVFPNGYVGVDMFLALSGYFLIRGLCTDSEKPFSFPRFAVKKVHRLAAPAAPVLLLTLLASWLLFPLEEFAASLPTGVAAVFGFSNMQLASVTGGYFAESTRLNPFTHTWYLGVTLQAYLIFGAAAWGMCRCSGRKRLWVLLGIGLLSAVCTSHAFLKAVCAGSMPDVYYWTSARLAEFAAGGLVVPLSRLRVPRRLALVLGTVALLFPVYATFSKHHHLGQVVALTTALLLVLPSAGLVRAALENKVMRFIGRISFSLYLVHWPVAVFAFYYFGNLHGVTAAAVPALCLVLGWVFYLTTERAGGVRTAVLWAVTAVVAALAYNMPTAKLSIHPVADAISHSRGEKRLQAATCPDYPGDVLREWKTPESADTAALKATPTEHRVYCLGAEQAPASFVLIGDSHARAMTPGLDAVARELGVRGYYLPLYLTPFYNRMYGNMTQRFDGEMFEMLCSWLGQHPELRTVVIGQRWTIRMSGEASDAPVRLGENMLPLHYDSSRVVTNDPYPESVAALEQFCAAIRALGKEVVLMTEAPFIEETQPAVVLRQAEMTKRQTDSKTLTCTADAYRRTCGRSLHSLEEMEQKGLVTLVRCDRLITENEPFIAWDEDGVHMQDDNHLSGSGSINIARRLKEEWRAVLLKQEEAEQGN